MNKGAHISPCGAYRRLLWREWDPALGRVCFCMLNPSTADADQDDPTIRRCIGFAKSWGYGGIAVVNLFAFRATSPRVLFRQSFMSAEGTGNWLAVIDAAKSAKVIVAAWGASPHPHVKRASREGLAMLQRYGDVMCLGKSKSGAPKHPLYVHGDTKPVLFVPKVELS